MGALRGRQGAMKRPSLTAVLALSLAIPGVASAGKPPAKPGGSYVDLQTIGLPAVVRGRLGNYIFAQLRLYVAPGVDASKIQQGEPVLRDALVHVAARTPFNPPDDGVRLDDARLKAEVMHDAQAQFGPGRVVSVKVQMETPQRRTGVPGAATLSISPPPSG